MPATAHVRALCCHLPTAKPTRMASNISHIRGTIIVVSTAIILVATAIVAATSIATTPELSYDCCYHFTSTNYHHAVTHIPHPHHHAKNCLYPVVWSSTTNNYQYQYQILHREWMGADQSLLLLLTRMGVVRPHCHWEFRLSTISTGSGSGSAAGSRCHWHDDGYILNPTIHLHQSYCLWTL